MAGVVDWTDPCARAGALSEAYFGLLSGAKAVRVRYRSGNNVEEDVQFQTVDLARLEREMNAAKAECETANGGPPRRFAIRGGARR